MENFSWLSFGKLRGSWGIIGNDKIGDYQYLDTYSIGESYNGTSVLSPSRLRNNGFSWEKTTKWEAAVELGLLKNRISFSTAWYRNRSSNQLVGIPLPATTGFTSVQANLPATVENTGWEFELNAGIIRNKTINWISSVNMSIPKNKLLDFPNLQGSTYVNQFVIGEPTSIVKVYQFESIDPQTGIYKFTDFNGDGKISSPDDNKAIERIGVKFFGGWQNEVKYKNWNFSFLFQLVNQRNWNFNSIMPLPGSMNNQPVEVLNVWSPSNPNGTYMGYSSGADAQKKAAHSYFTNSTAAISDASYIRLKNIQLTYNLELRDSWVNNAQIYIQGQNLLTLTNYFGLDPEFLLTGFLPPLKTFSLGLQLKF